MRAFARVLGVLGVFVLSVAGFWGLGVSSASSVLGEQEFAGSLSGHLTVAGTFIDLAPLVVALEPVSVKLDSRLYTVDVTPTTIVVRREATQTIGALEPRTYPVQYAIDRRTYRQVPSRLAYEYAPANVVDRSGSYGPVLPPDLGAGPYPVWDDAAGRPVDMVRVGPPIEQDGLSLVTLSGRLDDVPASDPYVRALRDTMGIFDALPPATTFEELRPMFAPVGIDPILVENVVHEKLAETDRRLAAEILESPVSIRYLLDVELNMRVEPETGMRSALSTTQVVAAEPDTTQLSRLYQLFAAPRYSGDPAMALAAGLIDKVVGAPPRTQLVTIEYTDTDASVAASVAAIKKAREAMGPGAEAAPAALASAGASVLLVGIGLGVREHRRGPAPESWRGIRARTMSGARRCRRVADTAARRWRGEDLGVGPGHDELVVGGRAGAAGGPGRHPVHYGYLGHSGHTSGHAGHAGHAGRASRGGYREQVVTVHGTGATTAPEPAVRSAFTPRGRVAGRPAPGQWSPVDVLASDDRPPAPPSGRGSTAGRRRQRNGTSNTSNTSSTSSTPGRSGSGDSVNLPAQSRSRREQRTAKPPAPDRSPAAGDRAVR